MTAQPQQPPTTQPQAPQVAPSPPPPPSSAAAAKRQVPQWREAVAGGCAGAFSRTVMAPLERIKLLKQLQGMQRATAAAAATTLPQNTSAWRLATTVFETEGLWAFWRGNLPSAMRVAGTAAINFTCMEYYKRVAVAPFLQNWIVQRHHTTTENVQRKRQFVTSLVSGGLAGATSTTLLYPFEFVRTRLAMDMGTTQQRQYKNGMRDVVKQIFRSDGLFGFYQGYGVAVTGGIAYRVMLLGGYDALKNDILYKKQKIQQKRIERRETKATIDATKLSWVERIASAQAISLMAGTFAYPFDSVRRRMMMQAGVPKDQRLYRHSIHCISSVFSKEGVRGFYLGLGPNILRSIGGALLLVGYDSVRQLL